MSASEGVRIAVVGIGCRFPGAADTPSRLWRLVAEQRVTVGPVPMDRWDAVAIGAFHDPDDAVRAGRGCFIDEDIWAWDPATLSVAPVEQRWVDPQFRLLMEVAWEAVEHAGIPMGRIRGTRTGVYMGTYALDNLFRDARPPQDAPNPLYLFRNFSAGAAGRIGFAMDLRGPVMVINTNCSSGLVAMDSACAALTLKECDTALAGAVQLIHSPVTHLYEAPMLLTLRGASYAFDARADGYMRGEGAGVLVLKRLADARRDGDRVLAVIRGSAVNNDGQATRLTAPSAQMQQRLFAEAVVRADVDPGDVGLVEAHGPGTAVGDPIEYSSIHAVYGRGRGRCALGSVKTNIGHSEPVSGIAGVIKVIEALRRGQVPPNANFAQWNPSIARDEESRLFVPTEVTPWPVPETVRLAAVCSYGVTGTNAHMVLEAASSTVGSLQVSVGGQPMAGRSQAWLFTLSGSSAESLALAAGRLADWAEGEGADTAPLDVAHTLALRRAHADHRLGVVARDLGELAARCRAFAVREESVGMAVGTPVLPPSHPGPVFVFTGQGSQRVGMCQELLADEPIFAQAIDELEPLVAQEAGFSLRGVITHPERLVGLERIQPTLFAVQVALARLWQSWGVEPAAVIGQSLGEVAAIVIAGGLAPADGVKVICRRSALLTTISGGAMASVMLPAATVQGAIEAAGAYGVSLGVLTSPGITVVSGDALQIAALVAGWEADEVPAKMIEVDVASHSPEVDPILDALRDSLAEVPVAQQVIPLYSTVSDDAREPGTIDRDYWVRNQRDTVRFDAAVAAALADGHRLFIECTAHPLAVRPIMDTAHHHGVYDTVVVGSLREGINDQDAFLGNLGQLHAAGYDQIDWTSRYGGGELAEVPGTAWHRTRHGGDEAPYQLIAPHLVGASQHPLLGGQVNDPEQPDRYLWQTPIGPQRLPWLADHQVADVPVLPGTGLLEMMLAAAARVFGTTRVTACDVEALSPLILDPEPQVTTRLLRDGDAARVEILTVSPDGITVHAHGIVKPLATEQSPPAALSAPSTVEWADSPPSELYRLFRERHNVQHGTAFTAVDRIRIHPTEDRAVSALHLHESARVSAWTMILHPALADQLIQTVVSVWLAHRATSPGPVVVAGFGEVRVHAPTGHTRAAHVELQHAVDLTCTASGTLATADGTIVAEVRGLRLANITPPEQRYASRLFHLAHTPMSIGQIPKANDHHWLILASENSRWTRCLTRQLADRSASARLLVHPPRQPLSSEKLMAALEDPAAPECTAVLLALDGKAETESPTLAADARTTVLTAVTVLQQAAARANPPRLWTLVHGNGLGAAGITGLMRAAAIELPRLRPSSLHISSDTPLEMVLDDLLPRLSSVVKRKCRYTG
ncbi:type I polyketide synthase [Streptomyces sp. KLMMK]|uniref:type I polyketide synthase n=1 Tax=Streptomyces sp. KLMMK TaxID=3109353 RepID=UPI0030093287